MRNRIICTILVLNSFIACNTFSQYTYWEDLSKDEQHNMLLNKDVNKLIYTAYAKNYDMLSDKDNLAETIISILLHNKNGEIEPLYFYLFNKACYVSDAGLSESIEYPCLDMTLRNTQYLFEYFTRQIKKNENKLLNIYASLIGYDLFYLYPTLRYKERLLKISGTFTPEQKTTINIFLKKIDLTIKDLKIEDSKVKSEELKLKSK